MKAKQVQTPLLLTLLLATGCASGGIPKAKYEALAKKYDSLKLENSGECATACGDCNDKVRRLEAELASLKGTAPRRLATRPAEGPPRRATEPPPVTPRHRVAPPPVAARPPGRRPPPERRPPPDPPAADPPAAGGGDGAVSHGLASNLNEWTGSIGEGLSTVGVLRAVLAQKDRFRRCYKKALKKHPGLTAKLTLGFLVDKKGKVRRVKDASPRVRDRKLRRVMSRLSKCARRAMKKVRFPPPSSDKSVPVVYPIIYKP